MAGIVVIATYRAKEGRGPEFEALVKEHVPLLRRGGYITSRPGEILRELRGDGIIEIFEWASQEQAVKAANDPAVFAHWTKMREAGEFIPHTALAEAAKPFCHFVPLSA